MSVSDGQLGESLDMHGLSWASVRTSGCDVLNGGKFFVEVDAN